MAVTPDPHVRTPETTPHAPFDDVREKPEPDVAAVNVAQVPEVYHVPAEMMHPLVAPETCTLRYPFPLNGVPGALVLVLVGALPVVVVPVGVDPPLLGRYLMPVAGQVDFVPSGFAGTNSPVTTEPRTS